MSLCEWLPRILVLFEWTCGNCFNAIPKRKSEAEAQDELAYLYLFSFLILVLLLLIKLPFLLQNKVNLK